MKHIKTYKLFESFNEDDFQWFKDLFQELKDEGFRLVIKESSTMRLDFSKSDVIDIHYMEETPGKPQEIIKTIDVKIEKRVIAQDNTRFFGPTLKEFNINEIKETLRFAESFAKDELGLEIEYIYTMRIPRYLYYSSVDALPDNQTVDSVTFAFRKKTN
jgi:hypothetical protein